MEATLVVILLKNLFFFHCQFIFYKNNLFCSSGFCLLRSCSQHILSQHNENKKIYWYIRILNVRIMILSWVMIVVRTEARELWVKMWCRSMSRTTQNMMQNNRQDGGMLTHGGALHHPRCFGLYCICGAGEVPQVVNILRRAGQSHHSDEPALPSDHHPVLNCLEFYKDQKHI